MHEMTSEQAIKILNGLQASQDKALAVVKLEGSAGHFTLYDFTGIASVIERLQAENEVLTNRIHFMKLLKDVSHN